MLGCQSIERKSGGWNKATAEAYASMIAIGVIAGVLVAWAQLPLHLPGHRVLLWMVPVLAGRMVTGRRLAASVGASATIGTTLLLGGRLAGGVGMAPMIILAGGVVDWVMHVLERRQMSTWRGFLFLAAAGTAANLLCLAKRLLDPAGEIFPVENLQDLMAVASSYAFFGCLAGLIGGTVGHWLAWPKGQNLPALNDTARK
ncbi:MAG TPA: hypothetical protein VL992_05485 [Tepidisphaeraceae bacterium]|nr:hypothetical protein [Tepidisphaeraceae bacterium]